MKTKYKVLLTAIGVILIISSIIITSVNLYNDQQNTILNLNNEIFGLTHTQPYFEPWHSWGNETIRGNNTVIQLRIGFINSGNGTAYQLQVRGCYATNSDLQDVTDFSFNVYRERGVIAGGNYTVQPNPNIAFPTANLGNGTPWLYIYCALQNSNSSNNGNWSEPCEQWLGYSRDQGFVRLADLTESQKQAFKPAVKRYYCGNETWG